MKASIEWLKEYSDINVDTYKLGDILTLSGSKVEEIIRVGNDIKNVVVGKILEIEKHPDADKLVVTKVDVLEEIVQIVTGANNIKVGDIVPIAKDNSFLPGGVNIKKGKLRGVDSFGMMCSIEELGLSLKDYPGQVDHGIMILDKALEAKIGEDITDVLSLKEDIIDFEITSNRPDCFSIEGLGRETAASLNVPFLNPRANLEKLRVNKQDNLEGLSVNIESDNCYRYIARVVKNVKIQESPMWLKRRLKAVGLNSINNIVDITNYVMTELGEPMHAFDINCMNGKHIIVRQAKDKEKITTLDKVERTLDTEDLVICDEKGPVALAGVMGGINSCITDKTNTIVFEAAVFNGGNVRKTAKKQGLRTDSSSRFEKGLSQENAERAVNRAIELVALLNAGDVVDGMIDVYPVKQEIRKIKLDVEKINKLLGTTISKEEMLEILKRLEISYDGENLVSPYFRLDIQILADIAEEVARFYGYDKIGTTLAKLDTTIGLRTKSQSIEMKLKELLVGKGFCEIYTYGFTSDKELEKTNISKELLDDVIVIQNPLADEFKYMRPSTIPSIMQMITNNYNKKNKNVRLFDISSTYRNNNNQIQNKEVPLEEKILTLGMYGEEVNFFTLKGIVENILEKAGVTRYDIEKEVNILSYHPGRCAKIKIGTDIFARFGEIHPEVADNYGIDMRIYVLEMNLSKITKYSKENKKYTEVPKFPAVERDIAITVNEEVEVGEILSVINKKAKKILESATLFDIYRDEKLGLNKKSLAFALIFRDKNKTLEESEIVKVMTEITQAIENTFDAQLRK